MLGHFPRLDPFGWQHIWTWFYLGHIKIVIVLINAIPDLPGVERVGNAFVRALIQKGIFEVGVFREHDGIQP